MAETAGGSERSGYLGLALMGLPMAKRLPGAGSDVAAWNRSPGKAGAVLEARAGRRFQAEPISIPAPVAGMASLAPSCVGG